LAVKAGPSMPRIERKNAELNDFNIAIVVVNYD
jgi:hypothetical protein